VWHDEIVSSRSGMCWPWYSTPGAGTTSIILAANQLQLVANVMWVLTCRCMIWFWPHNDLLWGFHIFRSGPRAESRSVLKGTPEALLVTACPCRPLLSFLDHHRQPATPAHHAKQPLKRHDHSLCAYQTQDLDVLYKPGLCSHI